MFPAAVRMPYLNSSDRIHLLGTPQPFYTLIPAIYRDRTSATHRQWTLAFWHYSFGARRLRICGATQNYFTKMQIIMKPYSRIQEILLVTTTSFAGKPFCKTDEKSHETPSTPAVQLEEACWNGLLNELLPEITISEEKLYPWQVEVRRSYLWISMGICTSVPENGFTLDPHLFFCYSKMN